MLKKFDLIRTSFIILAIFFCGFIATAHGDLHERILNVTEEIKAEPDSAFLYFKRGKLFHQHNNFTNSIRDLKSSRKLGYKSNEQNFLFAKNYYGINRFRSSKKFIDKILNLQPYNVNALKLLGKIYFSKKKFEKSALTFEKVIVHSSETFPENYLDASKAWYALRIENGIERAQSLLRDGIEELGNNIVLYNKLISYNVDLGDYSSAIKLQKKVIDFSHRKERSYLKLANLQILQKNYFEAVKSIEIAKECYNSLPYRIKGTKFMKDFYSELELKEAMLKNGKLK